MTHHQAAVMRHAGRLVAGTKACEEGLASWCQGCDETRLTVVMSWSEDGQRWRCPVCTGVLLEDDAMAHLPIIASVPSALATEEHTGTPQLTPWPLVEAERHADVGEHFRAFEAFFEWGSPEFTGETGL